jgi:hypothetical protein
MMRLPEDIAGDLGIGGIGKNIPGILPAERTKNQVLRLQNGKAGKIDKGRQGRAGITGGGEKTGERGSEHIEPPFGKKEDRSFVSYNETRFFIRQRRRQLLPGRGFD